MVDALHGANTNPSDFNQIFENLLSSATKFKVVSIVLECKIDVILNF